MLLFVSEIAALGNSKCRLVLDAGFLEFVSSIDNNVLASSLVDDRHPDQYSWRGALHFSCNLALSKLVVYPENAYILDVYALCTPCLQLSL